MPSARIAVRLQPRGGRNEIVGMREETLVVRVAAPPVDGRANAALCKLIAQRAGVPRTSVTLVAGERSRDKLIEVHGLDEPALRALLCA
jgi:uncharacterized protein (TIGR00251 family)